METLVHYIIHSVRKLKEQIICLKEVQLLAQIMHDLENTVILILITSLSKSTDDCY